VGQGVVDSLNMHAAASLFPVSINKQKLKKNIDE
jgi:hypothetical protein